jgi:hypothetical protein
VFDVTLQIARRVLLCLLAAVMWPRRADAQTGSRVVVRVLSDSNVAIGDADVIVFTSTSRLIGQGRTDSAGRASLVLPQALSGDGVVTARKVGFAAASRNVRLSMNDSVFVELRLARAARALPAVTVDASPLRLERRPFIDAAEIASDRRSILSLADVVKKLRWDVDFKSRKCLPRGAMGPLTEGPIPATRNDLLRMEVYVNGRWIPPEWDPGHLIHSEHIAEARYVDCFDQSIPGLPQLPWGALYVTLKPGIDWDLKRGSFERRDMTQAPVSSSLPRRGRLLGVFDDQSGNPVEDVAVTDSASGTTARTTATGTVSLGFLSPGDSRILIHKPGFVDQSMIVRISGVDTMPITIVLKRQPK